MKKIFAFIAMLMLIVTPASAFFFFGYDAPISSPPSTSDDSETPVDGEGSETPVDGEGSEQPVAGTPPTTTPGDDDSWFDWFGFFDSPPDAGSNPPDYSPEDFPAVWDRLNDVKIFQGTRDGYPIQEDITSKCVDIDDEKLVIKIEDKGSDKYKLRFEDGDLEIYRLDPDYTGDSRITLSCNGVLASFELSVIEKGKDKPGDDDGDKEGSDRETISVHIGSIKIPNQFDSTPGEWVPVYISIRNNGDKKLEDFVMNLKVAELGIRAARVGPFDVSIGKRVSKQLFLQLPENMEPGTYYARITMDTSNGVSRTIHREIDVI